MADEPEKIINLAVSPLGAAVIYAALEDVYTTDAAERAIDSGVVDMAHDDEEAFEDLVDRADDFVSATLNQIREALGIEDNRYFTRNLTSDSPTNKAADIADKMAKASHQAATGKAPYKP